MENMRANPLAQTAQSAPKPGEPTKVAVEIFGTTYNLKTDSDPNHLKRCAKMVDQHMKSISTRTRSFSGPHIGILAALELAEEYFKLKKDYDELLALLAEK